MLNLLNRAAQNSSNPATPKQIYFLASLLKKAGKDADWIGCGVLDQGQQLSKAAASDYIEMALKLEPVEEVVEEVVEAETVEIPQSSIDAYKAAYIEMLRRYAAASNLTKSKAKILARARKNGEIDF